MTKTNFHFLVNALPEVTGLAVDELSAIRSLIEENLDIPSIEAFRYLLYRNDNKNLIGLLRKRDGILPRTAVYFHTPAVFSFEDLDDLIIDAYEGEAQVPEYLLHFLAEEKKASWTVRQRENYLLELYYEAGTTYPQEFIREMFIFKRDLKNIMLALNARAQGFKITRITVGDYDLPTALARATQADLGLTGVYEFIPLLAELLSAGKLVELERQLDTLLLGHCATLTRGNIFSLNYVLYYFLELSLSHRWHILTPEAGERALEELVDDIIRTAVRAESAKP